MNMFDKKKSNDKAADKQEEKKNLEAVVEQIFPRELLTINDGTPHRPSEFTDEEREVSAKLNEDYLVPALDIQEHIIFAQSRNKEGREIPLTSNDTVESGFYMLFGPGWFRQKRPFIHTEATILTNQEDYQPLLTKREGAKQYQKLMGLLEDAYQSMDADRDKIRKALDHTADDFSLQQEPEYKKAIHTVNDVFKGFFEKKHLEGIRRFEKNQKDIEPYSQTNKKNRFGMHVESQIDLQAFKQFLKSPQTAIAMESFKKNHHDNIADPSLGDYASKLPKNEKGYTLVDLPADTLARHAGIYAIGQNNLLNDQKSTDEEE